MACFAELFNEMLMRDFGFQIFKAIHNAPEIVKEEKEDKVGVIFSEILFVILRPEIVQMN